jgi:aspartate aminotransferase-like enzyme
MIPHRGATFRAMMERMQPGLRALFGTKRTVLVSTSSATGLMEAAVRAAPPGPVLSVVHGAFSDRFAALAEACGHAVERYDVVWGEAPSPPEVGRRMATAKAAGSPFVAVTLVHSETSTGVISDVRAIAAEAARYGARCLVDSVTGIGGVAFSHDAWALDFSLTGSQKALALPPGLALGVATESFITAAAAAPARGLYLDLVEMDRYAQIGETPNTPTLSLIYALERQLEAIDAEGLATRLARHATMASMTHEWAAGWSARTDGAIRMLPPEGSQAPTVSVVVAPAGVSATAIVRAVADRGFVIGTGYGKLRETTFRIGHMGDHTPEGLARCLAACDAAIEAVMAQHA